jgi:uncharacterized protein
MIATTSKSHYTYKVPLLGNKAISFPDAEPNSEELPITHIDIDITEKCNLACSYCFKGKLSGKPMGLETAKQAVKFLVLHSADHSEIGISILGGEPMLAFDRLKEWIPWTRRYCVQRDKKVKIGITTNGTIFKKEHHDFFRKWNVGLHLSFDGCPDVQDNNRKFRNGKGTSTVIEKNLPLIFSCWRTIHARSTITPEIVDKLAESYKYFCKLGFLKVAFAFANSPQWNNHKTLEILGDQFSKVIVHHWNQMKAIRRHLVLSPFDSFVRRLNEKDFEITNICAAGNRSVLVDIHGFLWPCHRFSSSVGKVHKNLILGNVWGGFNNSIRDAFKLLNPSKDFVGECNVCKVKRLCLGSCIASNWQENSNLLKPATGYCMAMYILHRVFIKHIRQVRKDDTIFWNKFVRWNQLSVWQNK